MPPTICPASSHQSAVCREGACISYMQGGTIGLCEGGFNIPSQPAKLSILCGISLGRYEQVFLAGMCVCMHV